MIQKCSNMKVLEVFFKEPTNIHFIREIAREISLAQTSVRNITEELKKDGLIITRKNKPFNGFVANRENEKFIHYKQSYNFFSLFELKNVIIENIHPKAIIVFGSYSRGEDIEESDVDVLLISNIKKEINLERIENELKRKVNVQIVRKLDELDEHVKKNISNGWVIYGSVNG